MARIRHGDEMHRDVASSLVVEEEDGTPTGTPDTLKFTNGAVTDNGDGSFSVDVSGSGGAPTSIQSGDGTRGIDTESIFGDVGLWSEHTPGDRAGAGFDVQVGDDYVDFYISEKDNSTIQMYPGGGDYDIELLDGSGSGTGRWWAVANGGAMAPLSSVPRFARKASDQSFSTTTLNDSTGLSFATAAATTYRFRFVVFFTTNATSVGIRLSVNHSTAITAIRFGYSVPAAAPNAAGDAEAHASGNALNAEPLVVSAGPGGTATMAVLEGTMVTNTAGTFVLRHGSETATATTILAGSYGELNII